MEKEKLIQELLEYIDRETEHGYVFEPYGFSTNVQEMLDKIKSIDSDIAIIKK